MSEALMRAGGALASRAARVTFFEDRAEVERRAHVTLAGGRGWLAIAGVSALCDDSTVSAEVTGARVLGTRVRRVVRRVPVAGEAELAAAETDRAAAVRADAEAERALERARAHEERCAALLGRLARALAPVPRGDALTSFRSAHERAAAAQRAALDALSAGQAAVDRARLDRARAEARLAAARAVAPRYEATIEVEVDGPAGAAELVARYRVPCALWRPEHLARLAENTIEITTYATVWQRTGEDWQDLEAAFSTARPARPATPPLLADDHLARAVGARAVEEMPGVDDGGEPLAFVSARPVSLRSDGQPHRLEVARRSLPCTVELVALPERAEVAHLRARATLSGGPLLAGPVRLARGSAAVGTGRVGFVAPGEPFELGFGVDDGVRVRRRVAVQRDTATLTGAQKVTRIVRLYLSNLSGAPRTLTVIERLPVSELEDVEVELLEKFRPDGPEDTPLERTTPWSKLDSQDGFIRYELELPRSGTRDLVLAWRIRAPAKVQLGF